MTNKELLNITNEVREELKSIGIPISNKIEDVRINTKARSRLGACKAKKNTFGRKTYIIEISEIVLECEMKPLKSIIAHELLHTCRGCFNHGKKWKSYCDLVEAKLGYKIGTTQSYEDLGLKRPDPNEPIKYMVRCSGCGMVFPRRRKCSLVENPERYRCGKCGNILYLDEKYPHIL